MNKISLLFFGLFWFCFHSVGQNANENIVYIVDSIPVIDDPEDGNEINQADIADITIVKNEDSLKLSGFEKFDAAIYIFTKEYRNRPDSVKQIPSLRQMERKNGLLLFRDSSYTGQFIDYYYSGRKQGEGTFQNGKVEGIRTMYF